MSAKTDAALSVGDKRIFISYPRGGAAHTWAEHLHADLSRRGAEVWRDETGVQQGDQNWCQRIEVGLRTADIVACVVGRESESCGWQRREMLCADRLGLPVVALRAAQVVLPFYMIEKQPVECRGSKQETFDAFVRALVEQLGEQATCLYAPEDAPSAGNGPDPAQRQRELAYLNDLLNEELSTHEARYEPLVGKGQRAPTLERSHKGLGRSLRIDTGMLLQAFKPPGLQEAEQEEQSTHYADVLDAFTALPMRRARRLAVLGEPGAGKSFALERMAVSFARRALLDPAAPVPLLVKLGLWTREADSLPSCIASQIGQLKEEFEPLRNQRRAVLLLDGLNEIPPSQRRMKAEQVRKLAEDERFAAVLVSCRERDFNSDFALPFDRLILQPLTPVQVHRFLHRAYRLNAENDAADQARAAEQAEQRYWELAGGPVVQDAWRAWDAAGASLDLFWSADTVPTKAPDVKSKTRYDQDQAWREARANPRSLMKLAANPYVLTVMACLPTVPSNRAELFHLFLQVLHTRELQVREAGHDARSAPSFDDWLAVLSELALAMQHRVAMAHGRADTDTDTDEGHDLGEAGTALNRADCPAALTDAWLGFSQDASVLQIVHAGQQAQVRFTHQLLQEALASRVFIAASRTQSPPSRQFWPAEHWWQRNGWEVVAELAAEHCASDLPGLWALLSWLAQAQPEVAALAWQRVGQPTLPRGLAESIGKQWLPRLTDWENEPLPVARAAIGRALAAFDLDHRPGVGLRADGLPDIDWVTIPDGQPFIYQGQPHAPLPSFQIARYPVTHSQFQAFIDAGGYDEPHWWRGLQHMDPEEPRWTDANAPRDSVSWHEAMAFCAWLSAALQQPICLLTERQWERAAASTEGREYPWGEGYRNGWANYSEETTKGDTVPPSDLGRTSAVGIYPGYSADGVFDLAGNVWEWVADKWDPTDQSAGAARVLRGGAWGSDPQDLSAAYRRGYYPGSRYGGLGFRVCRGSPIDTQATGAPNAERLGR